MVYSLKGKQDLLEVYEDRVAITPKGVLGFMNKGLKGTKEIPFDSITAIQFKEASGIFNGFLQFTIGGGNESKGGLFAATRDENTFMFAGVKNNPFVTEIKAYVDRAISKLKSPQVSSSALSLSDELRKLGELRNEGILSEEEFTVAKRRLLD